MCREKKLELSLSFSITYIELMILIFVASYPFFLIIFSFELIIEVLYFVFVRFFWAKLKQ